MIHTPPKNRSGLCHLITNFHSVSQSRLARFDFLGVVVSGAMSFLVIETARFFLSH